MLGAAARWARAFRARVETKGLPHGLAYPWWIPTFSSLGQIAAVWFAAVQRDIVVPPQLALLAVLLVVLPQLVQYVRKEWVPWWLVALSELTAVTWLIVAHPMASGPADAVTGVLAILVAHVMVTDGPRPSLAVTAASIMVLVATSGFDDTVAVYLAEILFGAVVGGMLRWQMRALAAERDARAGEYDRATLAERQRIAREIHDLVGHSLSVTLLHVTGARRALREDGDVEEAVAALSDAERIGRRAMADIRRTVGVLTTTGPEGNRPLPTAADVEDLVADLRAAGLAVDYEVSGDLAALPDAVGLGIYRVVQESLANVAKHAPSARARVWLEVRCGRARVRVTNRLTRQAERGAGGTGLTGMASRAEQLGGTLRAGPDRDGWEVDMTVPTEPGS